MSLPMDELAQTLFEEAGDGLYFFDPDSGHILDVNPMAQRLTGMPRHELLRMTVAELFSAEIAGGMARLFRAYQSTGLFHSQEGFCLRHARAGVLTPVNLTVTRVHGPGRVLGLITARDISERRRAEETLRRSEQDYRNLFEYAHDPILLFEPHSGRVLDINRCACELYGFDRQEFLALSLEDISHDAATESHTAEILSQHGCHRFETVHRRKDGSTVKLEVKASVVAHGDGRAILAINRDVTERKRLEEQLRQALKMEAVGRLAGGVAHDFNNLLTVILGYSDCVLGLLPQDNPCRSMVKDIRTAGERAADLTGQLLAFGRKAIVAPKILDLNVALRQTEGMLRRLIGEDIELVTELAADAIRIVIDPGQLNQVILNLSVNARDAMPRGGRLTIRTTRRVLGAEAGPNKPDLVAGAYAVLTIADTGCGMSEDILPHIFEPFFTTKDIGKGTGLGLATVHSIVEQAGGIVEVETAPQRGALFRIYLPEVDQTPSELAVRRQRQPRGGGETLLLVEDEDKVRAFTRQVLKQYGYNVLEARDGIEALEVCNAYEGPLHLLVTDVVLPRLGGRELAQRTVQLRPEIKVLYISGYTDDTVLRHGVIDSEVELLLKPFSPTVLAGKVRELLDATACTPALTAATCPLN